MRTPSHTNAPLPPMTFPFFSVALQTQSTFRTGRQQRATWEQPFSCRVSGSQSDPDRFTWKQGDRPWNVLPAVTQTDNGMWKELKANKNGYPVFYLRGVPECDTGESVTECHTKHILIQLAKSKSVPVKSDSASETSLKKTFDAWVKISMTGLNFITIKVKYIYIAQVLSCIFP